MSSVQKINEEELRRGVSISASWHNDYRDTAFIRFSGLDHRLTEGDVLILFSQYGNPVYINLMRDEETGKSRGFGFLKYEDQRSTVLAVDNLNATQVLGRQLNVDHVRYFEKEGSEGMDVTEFVRNKGKQKQ